MSLTLRLVPTRMKDMAELLPSQKYSEENEGEKKKDYYVVVCRLFKYQRSYSKK